MAVTAVGMVFADILGTGSSGNAGGAPVERVQDILTPLMKLAAFIIPFALIPALFKFVGGFIGNLAGMVNDREKGMFDRLKQNRSKNYGQLGRDVRSGQFARNNTSGIGGAVSRGVRRASAPTSMLPGRLGSGGRAKLSVATLGSEASEEAEKDILANYSKDDGMWNEFVQYGHGRGAFQKRINSLRGSQKADGTAKNATEIANDNVKAGQLERMSSLVGNREYAVAAAMLASKSGKLQDTTVHALDNYYGNSAVDTAAKSDVAGGLYYNMKQKGNYVGAAIGVDQAGNFETYSSLMSAEGKTVEQATEDRQTAHDKVFSKVAMAGPGAIGNMPGYEMDINGVKRSAKDVAFESILEARPDPADATAVGIRNAAIEKLASEAVPGAYTDAQTQTFARQQLQKIMADDGTNYATLPVDADGKTVGAAQPGYRIFAPGRAVRIGSDADTAIKAQQNVQRMRPEDIEAMGT